MDTITVALQRKESLFQVSKVDPGYIMDSETETKKRKESLFQVSKVDILGGARNSGSLLLSRLVPPRLLFSGPEELIAALANPQNAGKPFTLQGWLYLVNRRFQVTQLNE